MTTVNLDDLIGPTYELHMPKGGALEYQFQLNNTIYQVVEDEEDGYRSSLGYVDIIKHEKGSHFLDFVTIVHDDNGNDDIYRIIGTNEHVWLEFGTDYYDDYYPCFVYRGYPK